MKTEAVLLLLLLVMVASVYSLTFSRPPQTILEYIKKTGGSSISSAII